MRQPVLGNLKVLLHWSLCPDSGCVWWDWRSSCYTTALPLCCCYPAAQFLREGCICSGSGLWDLLCPCHVPGPCCQLLIGQDLLLTSFQVKQPGHGDHLEPHLLSDSKKAEQEERAEEGT